MDPAPAQARLRLLVGLGNPGPEYAETRHNVGFMVLDRLAAQGGTTFKRERQWKAEWAKLGDLLLCKPLTYMNLSGEAVRKMASFHKVAPEEMLVVADDLALPLGKLRLRPGGSAGGHNGLKSLFQHLGTQAVPRLKVGIGESERGGTVGHVLGRFAPEEREPMAAALVRASEAVQAVQTKGLQAAMNAFN